jgi:hypothetical protein
MSACADRWRVARPASVALLLICLAGNAPRLGLSPSNAEVGDEAMLLQVADLAVSMDPPSDMRVLLTRGSGIRLTVGALRDARIAGDVPDPLEGTDEQRRRAFLLLLLAPSDDIRRAGCTPIEPGQPTTVERGDRLVIDGPSPVELRRVVDGVIGYEAHVPLTLFSPYAVRISAGPVDLVTAHPSDTTVVHCRSG